MPKKIRRAGFAYYKDISLVLGGGAFLIRKEKRHGLSSEILR